MLLSRATDCLVGAGTDLESERDVLSELQHRLDAGTFHLAVLGQFKRGKSTLLNALLGQALLPASVLPLTAIPTFVHPGPRVHVRVVYESGRAENVVPSGAEEGGRLLSEIVTESGNPKNHRGVTRVDVYHPAPIVRDGVVLIDTPGIGSTFEHNTETTLNFLPQCDAAVLVLSPDPPPTQVEIEFLRRLRSKVDRIVVVLNKVDSLNAEERRAAAQFLRQVLERHAELPGTTPVFELSAKQALLARQRGDQRLWYESGFGTFEHYLAFDLAGEKATLLREAIRRKAADAVASSLTQLNLVRRSLELPAEHLRSCMASLSAAIDEAQRQQIMATDLLAGDRRRMSELLDAQYQDAVRRAGEHFDRVLGGAPAPDHLTEEALQEVIAEAMPRFFELDFGRTVRQFEQRTAEVLGEHERRAQDLVESVRKTAAELFDVPYRVPGAATAFRRPSAPLWRTRRWSRMVGPVSQSTIDRLLPARLRRSRGRRRVSEQVKGLILRNAGVLREAMSDALDEGFARFRRDLTEQMFSTLAATRGAIDAAVRQRQSHASAADEQLRLIRSAVTCLEEIESRLLSDSGPTAP